MYIQLRGYLLFIFHSLLLYSMLFIVQPSCCNTYKLKCDVSSFPSLPSLRFLLWAQHFKSSYGYGERYQFSQRVRQTVYGTFWAENHAFGDTKSTINHLLVSQISKISVEITDSLDLGCSTITNTPLVKSWGAGTHTNQKNPKDHRNPYDVRHLHLRHQSCHSHRVMSLTPTYICRCDNTM